MKVSLKGLSFDYLARKSSGFKSKEFDNNQNNIKNNNKENFIKNEKGSALLEASIVLPFLLLCALGIFDFGRMFYTYHMVSEIAREAALAGAKIPGLVGNQVGNFTEHNLNDDNASTDLGGHEIIRGRIRVARAVLAESLPVPVTSINSRSQCIAQSTLDVNGANNGRALVVQVEAAYQPIYVVGLPTFNIRAEEVVSYLGGNPCNPPVV